MYDDSKSCEVKNGSPSTLRSHFMLVKPSPIISSVSRVVYLPNAAVNEKSVLLCFSLILKSPRTSHKRLIQTNPSVTISHTSHISIVFTPFAPQALASGGSLREIC